MSTRPPSPPPSLLKVALYVAGGLFLLFLVGVGLVAAACGGLLG